MDIKVEQPKSYIREMKIFLDYEKFEDAIRKVGRKYAKTAHIAGFRNGKAPISIVINNFKKEIEDEAQDNLIKSMFFKALKEYNLSPITYADIRDIEKRKEIGKFSFTAVFQVIPDFDLVTENIEVTYKSPKTGNDKINKVITELQEKYMTLKPVNRPSKPGDSVEFDYIVTDNKGDELDSVQGMTVDCSETDSKVSLGMMIKDLKPGDKKKQMMEYPREFPVVELYGKQVEVSIEAKEVKEKTIPSLDDNFAKTCGFDSLGELKNAIKKQLSNESEQSAIEKAMNKLIKKLIEVNKFEVPDSLVQYYLSGYKNSSKRDSDKEELSKLAENKAKLNIILDKIAYRDKIEIAEDELEKVIERQAEGESVGKKEFRQYLEKTGKIKDIIRILKREKTYIFLRENFVTKVKK